MVDYSACSQTPSQAEVFDVRQRWIDRVVVLGVRGEVDMLTAPRLIEAVDDAFTQAPAALIIDLTQVAFLASAGLNALVAAHQKAGEGSTPLGVVADGPATSRPITMVGIDAYVTLYPTLDEALRDLRLGQSS